MDSHAFRNPPHILRPTPFWAINDRLTPEETARQLAEMLRVGLGGGFFHARHGLMTDYLGEEWFAAMRAALAVAREKDGYLWLYDEDLWPSGNAGGQVAGMKDEYRATTLDAYLLGPGAPLPELGEDETFRYAYLIKRRAGLELQEVESLPLADLPAASAEERLLLVRRYQPKLNWWSGESYANLLHPEAMQEFIRLTHEVYFRELGAEFGKRIPGIFTDEPQLSYGRSNLAWYEGLPERYRQWQGRDFWADLPYLFFDGPEARRIRLLVHRTILQQFLEAYSKPLYEWCERHGLEHTGHFNWEDSFTGQIYNHYGSVMAHYRYQQVPGIDHLCRQVKDVLLTCKQVSSAARQLGRPRVLTEIFGVSRHTNTFAHFKWQGDFNQVLGVNFFCPHLTWYSARGRRKRDYPPVWNYQQTYWEELPALNDYFTRVAYALTRGKAEVPVLLLHSIESAIAARRLGVEPAGAAEDGVRRVSVEAPQEEMRAAEELDGLLRKTLDAILNAGYDCDLGDEGYLEDLGRVEGNLFRVGEMTYRVVVVPPSTTWRPRTLALLEEFAHSGGQILLLGELPQELDGVQARERWQNLARRPGVRTLPCAVEAVQAALDALAPASFTLKGSDGAAVPDTYVQHRRDEQAGEEIFFIVNADFHRGNAYVLTIPGAGGKRLVQWNPLDGTWAEAEGQRLGEDLRYEFFLPPAGSLLLTLGTALPTEAPQTAGAAGTKAAALSPGADTVMPQSGSVAVSRSQAAGRVQPLRGPFAFQRLDPNVLVLDRLSLSYDGGATFTPEEPEWRVRKAVAQHFGVEAALEWQPWVSLRKGLFTGKGGEIVLRYRFQSDLARPQSYLVLEDLEKGRLFVNGREITWGAAAELGWHWDRGFKMVEITDLVQAGENTVDFLVAYDFLTSIESAYVIGNFGVELVDPYRGKIVAEPQQLQSGSWVTQGYPFYSGRMRYRTDFAAQDGERYLLRLVRPAGTLFRVRVNAQEAGRILWPPYTIELTPWVRPGTLNQVEVEVISSLQNTWGPLHEKNGDDNRWVGPNAFEEEAVLREELSLFSYGLLGGMEMVIF